MSEKLIYNVSCHFDCNEESYIYISFITTSVNSVFVQDSKVNFWVIILYLDFL